MVADPETEGISAAASFTLTVNGTSYTVTPAAQSLSSLVDAINAIAGADVQATIVNVGIQHRAGLPSGDCGYEIPG